MNWLAFFLTTPALPETLELTIAGQSRSWRLGTAGQAGSLSGGRWHVLMNSDPTPWHVIYRELAPLLRNLDRQSRQEVLLELRHWAKADGVGRPEYRSLDEDKLRTLAQDGLVEIGDPGYTRKFGGNRVTHSDVLHAVSGNPEATLIGDLVTGEGVPVEAFDCIILTQTLPFIYDVQAALSTCYRALQPGGVVLATFPGISQISRYDMDRWGDYWRLTDASARKLFEDVFGSEHVTVETFGNILVACAFLHGLSSHELKKDELNYRAPDYQVLISVRAVKT